MKLNKLLPIVALSGIATVAMPLVSCATDDSGIRLNKLETIDLMHGKKEYILKTENSIDTIANTKYAFRININDYKWDLEIKDISDFGIFRICDSWVDCNVSATFSGEDCVVKIDGISLKYTSDPDLEPTDDNIFYIQSSQLLGCALSYKCTSIKKTSKITIEVTISDDVTNVYPMFLPSSGM